MMNLEKIEENKTLKIYEGLVQKVLMSRRTA